MGQILVLLESFRFATVTKSSTNTRFFPKKKEKCPGKNVAKKYKKVTVPSFATVVKKMRKTK